MRSLPRPLLPFILMLLLSLVACLPVDDPLGNAPDLPPLELPLPEEYPAMPKGLVEGRVVRVVDGDTVNVEVGGEVWKLRLIGVNTPESVDPRRPVQCFGLEASAQAKTLLDGQYVGLESDPTQGDADRYDRLLRYIWLADGRLFNMEMIRLGFANEYTYNTPYKYQEFFQRTEDEARFAGRGLWAPDTCGGDTTQPALPTPTATPSNCDPAYPDVCIPSPPPDLDCGEIPHRDFRVLPPDPHRFDGGGDGVGCEG